MLPTSKRVQSADPPDSRSKITPCFTSIEDSATYQRTEGFRTVPPRQFLGLISLATAMSRYQPTKKIISELDQIKLSAWEAHPTAPLFVTAYVRILLSDLQEFDFSLALAGGLPCSVLRPYCTIHKPGGIRQISCYVFRGCYWQF
jgi:hypothetical protein